MRESRKDGFGFPLSLLMECPRGFAKSVDGGLAEGEWGLKIQLDFCCL